MSEYTDLDVDAVYKVSTVLRNVADLYRESAVELSSAWQDKSAGKPWEKIARILERAADQIEKVI